MNNEEKKEIDLEEPFEKENFELSFDKNTHINGAIAYKLYKIILASKKESVVLVNIGTDLIIGDSLGPLIGSNLSGKLKNIKVYGSLDNLINAKNITERVEYITTLHKDSFILAIDACIGKEENVGSICLSSNPVKAGAAFRNDLDSIGDCSIKGVVSSQKTLALLSNTVRLSLVISMAKKIESEILDLDKLLSF